MGKLVNRCKMTVSGTPGTGAITLGSAATGFLDFPTAGVVNADVISYLCEDGAAWEYGQGTYTASGTTLARTTVIYSSSGAATAISLSASATVTVVPQAADIISTATSNAYTTPQQAQARANILAGAVENAAQLGFCVNPFMEISQENGQTSITSTNTSKYAADQFSTSHGTAGSSTFTVQNISDPFSSNAGYKKFRNAVRATIGTAQASLAAGEYLFLYQKIEGNFWKGLGWGTTDAASVDLVAVVSASVAGTYSLSLGNGPSTTRSYATPISLSANTPTVVFVTIPGDAAGTWATDTSTGLQINLTLGMGSTYQAPTNNAWQNGNYLAVNGGGTNLMATAGATFTIAYLNAFPTGVLPYTTAAQVDLAHLANMRRPYDDELRRCQRYYWRGLPHVYFHGNGYTINCAIQVPLLFPVPMRAVPTMSSDQTGWTGTSTSIPSPDNPTIYGARMLSLTTGATNNAIINFGGGSISANARM